MASKEDTTADTGGLCGIVMPISAMDACSAEHWLEVKGILFDVVQSTGLQPRLVSDSDESGVIQKRIVQNLYSDDVVVCDVSGKNPNVMFELGLRLAFDKPTIVIKDDATDYSFDTGVIEHVGYPRDLRFTAIIRFKEVLAQKIVATHKASREDPNYSTFLKNFGDYKVAHLEEREVSSIELVLVQLEELRQDVARLSRRGGGSLTKTNSIEPKANAAEVVSAHLKQFCKDRGFDEIEALDHQDELLAHLETIPEVRSACRNQSNLRRLILEALIPF